MKVKKFLYIMIAALPVGLLVFISSAAGNLRENIEDFMHSVGMEKQLAEGVEIHTGQNGIINISDNGTYLVQHVIQDCKTALNPTIVIKDDVKVPPKAKKVVVVVHGWVDKAEDDWPTDMAMAIQEKTDPNEWFCAVFDWRKGSRTINAVDAAKYARDVAGPRLAAALCVLSEEYEHIHMIAHSAGSWVIDSAAKNISQKHPETNFHLTFLDAYIPPKWDSDQLAKIPGDAKYWADHYYTKDFTMKVTQANLANACNVDLTDIDPYFKEHRFPYRWYYATIAGKYGEHFTEKNLDVLDTFKGITYGFTRSLESGMENFQKSLSLKPGGPALKLKDDDTKKSSNCPIFGSSKKNNPDSP